MRIAVPFFLGEPADGVLVAGAIDGAAAVTALGYQRVELGQLAQRPRQRNARIEIGTEIENDFLAGMVVPREIPPEYWESVLNSPLADARSADIPIQRRHLFEISRHQLRVGCRRCDRVVENQTADAVRLYGWHTT